MWLCCDQSIHRRTLGQIIESGGSKQASKGNFTVFRNPEVLKALNKKRYPAGLLPPAWKLLFGIAKSAEPEAPEAICILGKLECVRKDINIGQIAGERITYYSPTVILGLIESVRVNGKVDAYSRNLEELLKIPGIQDLPYLLDRANRPVKDPEQTTGLALARQLASKPAKIIRLLEALHSKR